MDIDQDGHLDIVSGSYSRSSAGDVEVPVAHMAGLFQVLYGRGGGKFRKAETLNGPDGRPLVIPGKEEDDVDKRICTRQHVVDWNGDGKLDLLTGNFEGTFFWFRGEGKGKFDPKPEPIHQGGKPLAVASGHSDPFVVDWDRDGDLDLLSGATDAGVYLAENSAGKGKAPELKPFKALIAPSGRDPHSEKGVREADLKNPTYTSRIWVDDVNGDGKLDVLVGDGVILATPKNTTADRTGFVWLYLQK